MMMNLPCLMASCANFLRPICSYTECRLSFQTGSCPTECTTASYSSCFYFDFTDHSLPQGTGIPWTLCPVSPGWSCWWCSAFRTPSLSGFFSRTLPDLRTFCSGTRQGSGITCFLVTFTYAACACSSAGRLMSINIFFGSYTVPFVRIV